MRVLLDTHVLLWWMAEMPRLGSAARAAIDSPETDVHISAVTVGEIEIKRALGKLDAPDDMPEQMDRHGFTELPLTVRHAVAVRELPLHHKDPFDRMLVAQARVEGLTLVTADRAISKYDVRILPAGD
ncbi:type II toxin-antitoxin system VapC family toxin [Pseudonocardia nigra]|uniref:type II toxin-antitoxin system VapC family toxin n=1 Tax=Pseudonocardia nigra TaxID=1921578 RepID=UPI001C5F7E99|nr:type II toxin-antitoxin system VapC family toxin [Pseudonocardia nigra]